MRPSWAADPSLTRDAGGSRRRRRSRLLLIAASATLVTSMLAAACFELLRDPPTRYETVPARTGAVSRSISAVGSVEPSHKVEVGAEVSGLIRAVLVTSDETVHRGQLLAEFDTSSLEVQAAQGRAGLEQAQAGLAVAKATLKEASLRRARVHELASKGWMASQEDETAEATYARAEAGTESAAAQIAVAKASLDATLTLIRKTKILSPIDGIVLERFVEPGQTVAAEFQTPRLFSLIGDPRHMTIRARVNESDVVELKAGAAAEFSVDAFPDRAFPATLSQIHYAPRSIDGVVSYEVILDVDNADLLLRPGMTASVKIVLEREENAMLIPNAALRFVPSEYRATFRQPGPNGSNSAVIWVQRGAAHLEAVPLTLGISDGKKTAVVTNRLAVGDLIATDEVHDGAE